MSISRFLRMGLGIGAHLPHATLILLVSTAAVAGPADAPDPNKLSMQVSLADLNLSTREGARIAEQRLRRAARRLCARLSDELDLGKQPHLVACVDQAMADAHRSLGTLALNAQATHPEGH